MYEDVAKLITYPIVVDGKGSQIKTPVKRQVFVDRKSVRQAEFYQAQANGLRPDYMFVMRRSEYLGEPHIEFDGKIYDIIRVYEKDKDFVEIIAQGLTNGVG